MARIFTLDELLAAYPPPYNVELPFDLNVLQKEDVATLLMYERAGMFLPVGYGKTVIATLVALAWDDPYVIVLLPPILIPQWVKWLNAGFGHGVGKALAYEGTIKERKAMDLRAHRWLVMSYGIFKNDLVRLIKELGETPRTTLVDEVQALKNPGSVLFKAVETFSSGYKLLMLTGTEMNKPDDAYAYIKLKTPLVYRSKAHFDNLHVAERDFFRQPILWNDLPTITANLYLNSAHRTKEEVHAHLPKANYEPKAYSLHPEHFKLYQQMADQMILETLQGGKIDGSTPQRLRNHLQQIILNWEEYSGDPKNNPIHEGTRPTFYDHLDFVMDQIDVQNPDSSKIIVWTWFKKSTRRVCAYLNEIGVPAVAAYSEVDSRKSVQLFMEDKKVRALVAQPGSAGAGLNPQYICWTSFFAEFPTRTILFRQSAGRIDREGQRFNPNIFLGLANNTVQPGMYSSLLNNDGLVQRVAGNEFDLRKLVYG